ncbi:MAG: sensor histidine kinase [Chloroflexota bacterium]
MNHEKSRQWWPLAVSLAPLGLGLVAALLWQAGLFPDPVLTLRLRADVGTLLLLAGALVSLLALPAAAVAVYAARRRVRELEAARGAWADDRRRFLRRLDHELKNPLTGLRAGLANLASLPDSAERDAAQASVEAQLMRLNRLVGDLRKLVELEQRPLERAAVDVGTLLTEMVDVARETLDRQVSLTLPQAPWPLPPASGDQDLIFLACYNLVDNACKFTRPGDAIEVRAFEDDRWIVVEVADTGPGIPEEERSHVFEELYRGDNARAVEGSGLGLALVRAVARHHGGRVAVRSREGEGTAFTLRLPQTRPV